MSTKAELHEMGEETEYAAETVSDYRNQILGLTANTTKAVDIMDANGIYKSTTQILRELSQVWNELNTNEQAAIEKLLAGARQANIFSAIMTNFDDAEKAIEAANNATGAAMKEQEAWENSIVAKKQELSSIFQSISSNILNSDDYKKVLDFFIKISEAIDNFTKKGTGLTALIPVLTGIFGASGNGIFSANNVREVNKLISSYNVAVSQGTESTKAFTDSIKTSAPNFYRYTQEINGAEASMKGYRLSQLSATASTIALKTATIALNTVINAGIGLIISFTVNAISKWINHNKELTQSLKDASTELESNQQGLEDYKAKIDEIINSTNDEYEKIKSLNEIKDELNTKYNLEIENINSVTEARRLLNEQIDAESSKERNLYLSNAENRKAYENAKKALTDNVGKGFWGTIKDWFTGSYAGVGDFTISIGNLDDISKDIQNLFDTTEQFSDYYAGNQTTFGFNKTWESEIEYFEILEKKYLEFADIRSKRIGGLSDEEEALFNLVSEQYDYLKEKNADYISNVESFSKLQAQQLIDLFDQGTLSRDEYYDKLSQYADGDIFVIKALKELIYVTESATKETEELNNPLSEVVANLQKIGTTTAEMTTEIDNANESFEKLEKTFKTNQDADKYFSATEIIELLDLYPQLNDAILESQYGYKIEEEALEALRQAKLNEKKTALQAQLEETKGLLETTKEKLEAYRQEINGIKDLAEAQTKLAALEAQLAQVRAANTTDPYKVSAKYLEGQIANIRAYVEAQEQADKYSETIKKLQTQINVLGNVFEDAKDATQDQTKALNEQKEALKNLKDEMDDAKKDIEDLVKLTTDMLKKNANLRKEDLKDQLDSYKKLIDRQKELIDLKKSEEEFSKKLADQNRDVLNIQQEIDALSIEGANYSLEDKKRKAELEQKLIEEEEKRTDLLADHETDVRKKALDEQAENFEQNIQTQIKAIEDYLDHEGKIRAEAIDLINSKSQQFYDDLLNYTMNYTDKSEFEFNRLWNKAYEAIMKYAGGQLNVDLALANLIAQMELAEAQMKNIENQVNSLKNATSSYTNSAINGMNEYNKVLNDTQAKMNELKNTSWATESRDPRYYNTSYSSGYTQATSSGMDWSEYKAQSAVANLPMSDTLKKLVATQIRYKYHDGGVVDGVTNKHGEVLAKLLKGEVVATEQQARNFMENTLPKLASAATAVNNNSISPVINMGDIVINGDADSSTIEKLKSVRDQIVNDVFKAVNEQTRIFNGGYARGL